MWFVMDICTLGPYMKYTLYYTTQHPRT